MDSHQMYASVVALMDREAIRECMFRYCRGIDRQDEAALRSAYWPDATDRHGPYQGSAAGFIDWALEKLRTQGERSVHNVANLSITLRGNQAAVETYFTALQRDRDAQGTAREVFLAGRYLDRFEKRGEEWRIAQRTVVYDWVRPLGTPEGAEAERFGPRQPIGGVRGDDPVHALLAAMQQPGSQDEPGSARAL
ncbi:nuclear transport factor 2 family protein [Variovorax sp. J22P271]|uniref:nuclear transport factor 2 family protein n=1 Tax=Variovorax davisae TaxID=3053515 RepID=UPI002576866C|nr:nuclear transport factor 2 family protein [Variovorax sp. J22P271]MDM0035646.1 nuclear transport factor 2 family protein [Variovorax sp. J22P271]